MLHAPAAYIASVCSSGYGHTHLTAHVVEIFNSCVAPSETTSLDSILTSPLGQKALLPSKLDDLQFHALFNYLQWLIGHAYFPPLPLILHHGFQLSPQKVLASTLNQISTILLSEMVAWLRHFRWLTVFPLPRFHPGSLRSQTRGRCCASS